MSQYFFAWVDEADNVFGYEHLREDEQIVSYVLRHGEGEFATLDIVIRNPREAFLAPTRNIWAWFAVQIGSEPEPLLFGRLIGVPENLHRETVKLTFVAKPEDFVAQKTAVATGKRVAPYWDPIWFDDASRSDPDNILESRPELWHIDRVTHEVLTSDITAGEDGTLVFEDGDIINDSLDLTYGEVPARRVALEATVSWDQKAKGRVDITGYISQVAANTSNGDGVGIWTYTGDGLVADWPKEGAGVGGGWSLYRSSAFRIDPLRVPEEFLDQNPPGRFARYSKFSERGYTGHKADGYNVRFATWYHPSGYTAKMWFPLCSVRPQMNMAFDANRRKNETLTFVLEADVQPVLASDETDQEITINLNSSEISEPIDPLGVRPLGNVRNRSYFSTDRGEQSIAYLISVARARLLSRARMVYIDFEVSFSLGIQSLLSCRKNAVVRDPRLPGIIAGGKIINYEFGLDGNDGREYCRIKMACMAGEGQVVVAVAGEPDYVEDDYVEDDYQVRTGEHVMPIAGQVTHPSINGFPPVDDGVDFNRLTPIQITRFVVFENGRLTQEGAMNSSAGDQDGAFQILNSAPTRVRIGFIDLNKGPFLTPYDLGDLSLMVPKTIDLAFTGNLYPSAIVNVSTFGQPALGAVALRPETVINVSTFGEPAIIEDATPLAPATIINVSTFGTLIFAPVDASSTIITADQTNLTADMT